MAEANSQQVQTENGRLYSLEPEIPTYNWTWQKMNVTGGVGGWLGGV